MATFTNSIADYSNWGSSTSNFTVTYTDGFGMTEFKPIKPTKKKSKKRLKDVLAWLDKDIEQVCLAGRV